MEITDLTLLDLSSSKDMTLEFGYSFTVEKLKARIEIKYDQTRYAHYTQQIRTTLNGVSSPLIYSDNIATYIGISIMLFFGTGLSLMGLLIGLLSPKYIGLESLLTLQLIFYSQLLIAEPSNWPIGFLYLKYLKFASGYNDIFAFTTYVPLTYDAKKMQHLDMKKTIVENLNINFVIFFVSLLIFFVMFIVKYLQENSIKQQEMEDKNTDLKQREDKATRIETHEKLKSFEILTMITEKAFWILNHLGLWMLLPLLATIAAHIFINNHLTETIQSSSIQ